MIRVVQYAKTLDGKMIEVEQGPHKGWAIGERVFASEDDANQAAGLINQQCYIDEQVDEIEYGISQMIYSSSPFEGWREKYDSRERERDLTSDIIDSLFPRYGERSEYAKRFAEAFTLANAVYLEMKG